MKQCVLGMQVAGIQALDQVLSAQNQWCHSGFLQEHIAGGGAIHITSTTPVWSCVLDTPCLQRHCVSQNRKQETP